MVDRAGTFLDEYLPYVLRRADQTLSAAFYETLNAYDIGRSEWRVLAVLHELGELSILDLTAASLSPQPTVTQTVRRLEERKLVRRTKGTRDKRQRFVSVTPSGEKLTATLIAEARALEADLLGGAEGLDDLRSALATLTAHIEARAQARGETTRAG